MPNRGIPVPDDRFKTQVVDLPLFGGTIYPPVSHPSEAAARGYAKEVAARRRGEVRILGEFDQTLDTLVTE